MENLPVEFIEEVKFMVKLIKPVFKPLAKPIVDTIRRLHDRYKNSDDDDLKDCIEDAVLMLTQETQAQKRFHLDKFVENTLLDPECELEPATIFYLLQDIKQMTWRQLCLLAGFKKVDTGEIEIQGHRTSGINAISIDIEIKKLIDLEYLYEGASLTSNALGVRELGIEISELLDLQSVDPHEILKAFGREKITEKKQYTVESS